MTVKCFHRQRLTGQPQLQYGSSTWGVPVVKRSRWALVLSLITMVTLVSIVPIADQPETAFNENDTPVNAGTPIAPLRVAPPSSVPMVLPGPVKVTGSENIARMSVVSKSIPTHWHPSPLCNLLCTFLI